MSVNLLNGILFLRILAYIYDTSFFKKPFKQDLTTNHFLFVSTLFQINALGKIIFCLFLHSFKVISPTLYL